MRYFVNPIVAISPSSMLLPPENEVLNDPDLLAVSTTVDETSVSVKQASTIDLQFIELINAATDYLKADSSKIVDLVVSYIPEAEKLILSALQDHDKLATLNLTEFLVADLALLCDGLTKQKTESAEDDARIEKALKEITAELFRRDEAKLLEAPNLSWGYRSLVLSLWERIHKLNPTGTSFDKDSGISVVWGSTAPSHTESLSLQCSTRFHLPY